MQVVEAMLGHALAIVAILTDATQYKLRRGDMAWGQQGPTERAVQEQLSRRETYVALRDNDVIATFRLQWEDKHYWGDQPPVAGYMHGLAVREDAHGKAVGAQLVAWAAQEVSKRGRQYLRLDCDARNFALCRYYDRLGFIQTGQRALSSGYVASLLQCEASSSRAMFEHL